MKPPNPNLQDIKILLGTFFLLSGFAFWLKTMDTGSPWQQAGLTTFSLGFVVLAAHVAGRILGTLKLPLISGYIFVGIVAGPHVTGVLSEAVVERLRVADDLALSFIALTAGGALQMKSIQRRAKAIFANICFQALFVFVLVFAGFYLIYPFSGPTLQLSSSQIIALACLLGVISAARSPASAIAVINECRASGMFTTTVLGVTIAMDVIIIMLFTLAMTVSRAILATVDPMDYGTFLVLCTAVAGSLAVGALLGKGIALYMEKIGQDLSLFLLFIAFGVFKSSEWFNYFMETQFSISLHLEPLLICISAGFTIQNFSRMGRGFMKNMDRMALPIYVLFFSLTGACLNLQALYGMWLPAVVVGTARAAGIMGGAWLSGIIAQDPPLHGRTAWMAHISQAGVAVGLARLAERQFPDIGVHVMTLVLAVITINQIVGPILMKFVLERVGEAHHDG